MKPYVHLFGHLALEDIDTTNAISRSLRETCRAKEAKERVYNLNVICRYIGVG